MERIPVSSSNLASVGYQDGILEVAFKSGSVYQYTGVPESVYEALMSAPSHGKFLLLLSVITIPIVRFANEAES